MAGRSISTGIFKTNLKKVKIGDPVCFIRKELTVYGEVVQIGENTVMVTIDEQTRLLLDISTNITVVNHRNYKIQSMPFLSGQLV